MCFISNGDFVLEGSNDNIIFNENGVIDAAAALFLRGGSSNNTELQINNAGFTFYDGGLGTADVIFNDGVALFGTTTPSSAEVMIQTSGTQDILNLFETGGHRSLHGVGEWQRWNWYYFTIE